MRWWECGAASAASAASASARPRGILLHSEISRVSVLRAPPKISRVSVLRAPPKISRVSVLRAPFSLGWGVPPPPPTSWEPPPPHSINPATHLVIQYETYNIVCMYLQIHMSLLILLCSFQGM